MALLSSELLSKRLQEFQGKLSQYLANRQKGQRTNPSFFTKFLDSIIATDTATAKNEHGTLTIFGRFTLKNKHDAIQKINNELNGKPQQVTYFDTDIEAARDGDLGKILEQYEDILPAKFKSKERSMKEEQERRISEREFRTRK